MDLQNKYAEHLERYALLENELAEIRLKNVSHFAYNKFELLLVRSSWANSMEVKFFCK
jgi:hypothetical protein